MQLCECCAVCVFCEQEPTAALGTLPPPITANGPNNVPGEQQLTQALSGPLITAGPENRGLNPVPRSGKPNIQGPAVAVGSSLISLFSCGYPNRNDA